MNRREFLYKGGQMATAACFASVFTSCQENIKGTSANNVSGPIEVPKGFKSWIIQRSGDVMSDGKKVLARPDGMACFEGPNNTLILMRNHEVENGGGGVSRVVLNKSNYSVISSNMVLEGTSRNCAGGISPWGWLSCEETFQPGHGFVYLCDPNADSVQPPRPIENYGRFNHEAAVVDPTSFTAYLSEDREDGGFYRFLPHKKSEPFVGQLQALKISGFSAFNTSDGNKVGDQWNCEWVNINNPAPKTDTLRNQGIAKGSATFNRGEGVWLIGNQIYLACTSGGPAKSGQIFRYTPQNKTNGTLELVAQSTGTKHLNKPDNIAVAPWGDLFIAEDGRDPNHIRVLKPDGSIKTFAKNSKFKNEFAGVCFDPDGQIMFANLQKPGVTLAVTGPWKDFVKSGSGLMA